jgi:hypothetical protein
MKNSVTPALATSNASTVCAALNSLALLSPQRFNKPLVRRERSDRSDAEIEGVDFARLPSVQDRFNLQGEPSVRHLVPCAELTFGTRPDVLIWRAVEIVEEGPLRDFLRTVTAERDVSLVLTVLQTDDCMFQRRPIERLRAAAHTAAFRSMQGPRTRDTLYAAVLIAGIESLLGQTVQEPYTSLDVIKAVVRPALATLTAADPQQAANLCNCLGWGNVDEMDDLRTRSLHRQIQRAVKGMHEQLNPVRPIHMAGHA